MTKKNSPTGSDARQPDYDLSILHRISGIKGRAGAAWKGKNGAISITLNPGVHLNSNDWVITLFPRTSGGARKPTAEAVGDVPF